MSSRTVSKVYRKNRKAIRKGSLPYVAAQQYESELGFVVASLSHSARPPPRKRELLDSHNREPARSADRRFESTRPYRCGDTIVDHDLGQNVSVNGPHCPESLIAGVSNISVTEHSRKVAPIRRAVPDGGTYGYCSDPKEKRFVIQSR